MFRRSLILFGAIVLLGLLLTYGYALFGFGGPGGAIAQARLHVAAGDYLRAINDLDLYERSVSLKRDPEKFRELLRLRYVSHDSLGNSPAALRDLERLLAETEGPGEQLRLDHIRLLALTGAGEAALTEARAFLVDHPDHGRALELAGEACQTIYRAELAAVLAQLELDVAARDRAAARSALLAYLYRPEGDTEVEVALATLQQAYSADSRLVASWPPFRQRLAALRTHILEAIGFFQQSLEAGDEPVAAFHGLALSLEQAERFDDLLLLCESYRHRFDHAYVQDAGSLAAWALVQLGLEQNAIATVNRWLPPGQVAEGAVAGRITGTALDLYLARIVAAWRLQDAAALDRIRPDVRTLLDAKLPVYLALTLLTGLSAHLRNQTEPCEAALAPTMRALQRTATPHGQVDLLGIVAPVRAANLRAAGATNAEVATVLTDWIAARPDTIEPLVAYADHQLAAGVASGAMTTARAAQRIAPNDESLLTLRLRIARELYRDTGQDGPGLLLQCKQRATVVPEVPDPICYLLCGEAALTAGVAEIARACGRAAVDAMPRARAGRLLEARGELLAGRPATAAVATDNLLASLPPDRETVELALTAHRAAGKSNSRLHWLALRTLPPNPRLATEVLRDRSDDGAGVTLPLARAQLAQPELPPGLAALTAATFARAGDRATAERLLGRIASDPDTATAGSAELTADLATAVAELLRLGARSGDVADAALSEQALGWLLRFGLPGAAGAPVLIALARDLATERPNTAYALVSTALAAADPEQRDGGGYALAGDLALRLGHDGIAESNWTAALAFPDGRGAAESLARLCFATDRAERALQVYRLATDVADPALALRCGNLAAAERLLAQALERDPGDLLANVVVTVVGQPSPTSDLAIETAAERDLLLELASILRSAGLAKLALPRLRDLAERQPTASAKLLLARGLWLAGEGKAAAALHGELFEQGMATLPFWREVAAAACVPGYEPVVAVAAGLAAAAANGELAKSPFSYAVAVHRLADVVAAAGHGELALAYRAPAWLQFDPEIGLTRHWVPTVAVADRL
ncbi:MAG: hypothetical protein KDE27_27930, partial [Planctomycetes bacterium]|nr:hypothetical protein [Planctomycetota bacterium]